MTALPAATDFTGASITEAQFKTAITELRAYLSGLLGDDGEVITALQALGAVGSNIVSKSANYTVAATDRGKLIDGTGTFTLSLTAAATLANGFSFAVRNSGTGVITIDPNLSELIDGVSTLAYYPGESFVVVCSGSAFKTIGRTGGVQAGTVAYHAASTAPSGWLKCDGSAVSRTTYAALYNAIGVTFGLGDGSTTFNLPDLRGEFMRGWDDGRGVDSGRVFGSAQAHQMQSHTHSVQVIGNGTITGGGYPNGDDPAGPAYTTGSAGGGSENRPRNIALLAIIKF